MRETGSSGEINGVSVFLVFVFVFIFEWGEFLEKDIFFVVYLFVSVFVCVDLYLYLYSYKIDRYE